MILITLLLLTDFQIEHSGSYFIEGQYLNVKTVDSCAYFSTCRGLEIYDYTDPGNPQMLGSAVTEAWATSVDVTGNYAYLADQFNGLCIFDISDPANPFVVGRYDTEGCTEYVMVQDTLAYLADGDRGLVIINVSNPANPFYVGTWTQVDYYAFTVFIKDTLAYLGCASDAPLKIINVANPQNPYLIAEFPSIPSFNSGIVAAYVADTLAFLVGSWLFTSTRAHFLVANVADPGNPVLVSIMYLGEPTLGVLVDGDRAYVTDQTEGVKIIDVSNPTAPVEVGHFDESTEWGYGCAVHDSIMIVPHGFEGFSVVDVSNPACPVRLFRKPNYPHVAFEIESDYRQLYLYNFIMTDLNFHMILQFVDVSDITIPIVRSELNSLGRWTPWYRGPGLVTDHPYLAFGLERGADEFLGVVDIADIDHPQLLRFEPGTFTGPLALAHPYVYAGYQDMLIVGDVNATPFWTDTIALPEYCNGIAIDDSIGYVACRFNLTILDLHTNSLIATYSHGRAYAGCNGGVIIIFPYLYMSFSTDSAGMIYNGFLIFDVSNPNMPSLLSQTMTPEPMPWYIASSHAKSCYLSDTLLYHCRGRAGFDIYNVSNPAAPALILTRDTPYSCDDIYVIDDTLFVMDGLSVEVYRLVDTGIEEMPSSAYTREVPVLDIYPDPFRVQTCISYNLEHISYESNNISCLLDIYDVSGRLVKSFNYLAEYSGQVSWHGEDDNGRALPQGVYFVRLKVGAEFHVRKVVLLK